MPSFLDPATPVTELGKIEPCPYCGNKTEFDVGGGGVECVECLATGPMPDPNKDYESRKALMQAAVFLWNFRKDKAS